MIESMTCTSKMQDINGSLLNMELIASLSCMGFGTKKRLPEAYKHAFNKMIWRERAAPITVTGAGKSREHVHLLF